jgi:outer membrane protein
VIALWLASAAIAAAPELTVEQAMALAIAHNPSARSARLGQLIADIGSTRAELDRYTATVGVDGDFGIGVTKPPDAPGYGSQSAGWSAGAEVGVPLYSGGRVDALVDRAHADADLAGLEVAITERDLVRAAYTAYWNVRGLELGIAATEEGLAATTEALDIIRSKADNGLAAGIDVNRSTVDLLSQQEGLLQQRGALARARQQLAQLIVLDDDQIGELVSEPAHGEGAVALPADPLADRPEIARQQLSVDQAEADRRVARAGAFPTVALTGSASVAASALGGGGDTVYDLPPPVRDIVVPAPELDLSALSAPIVDGRVGIALTWTPFDLLRTRHGMQQAAARIDQVAAANEGERLQLLADVRSTAAEVDALRARYPLVAQQLVLARDNQDIVQDLYAQGSATILDLFNAQAAFRAAAIQEAALAVDLTTAELDLRWLLGEDLLSGVSQ